jgi:hypothetical protein
MDSEPPFGFKELFTHVVGNIAKAMCERNGETKQQQHTRSRAAAHLIMSLLPRDAVEAMLAGHCVMFHELMLDSLRETLRGEMDTMRQSTRNSIVAMNKCFMGNLDRLARYQNRPADGSRDQPDAKRERVPNGSPAAPSPSPAIPVPTPAGVTTEALPAERQSPETKAAYYPSREAIAACMSNPEAVAALDAGDPIGFARALGIAHPDEAYIAAATVQMAAFNQRTSKPQQGNGQTSDPERDREARPVDDDDPTANADRDSGGRRKT